MHAATVVDALKRLLKAQGITYAVVAAGLDISEASVKRMFSRRDFTLQRLEDVCRVAGIEFADLARAVTMDNAGISYLTVEQEEEIVADPKLLLVALCALGNWTVAQIVETYNLTHAECISLSRTDVCARTGVCTAGDRCRVQRTGSQRAAGASLPVQ